MTDQSERTRLTILEACGQCGVSRRTIYNWLNSGKLEYVRTPGGSVRIFEDSLWRGPNDTVAGQSVNLLKGSRKSA